MSVPKPLKAEPKAPTKAKAQTASTDFELVSAFHGYRNREDKTNLPPGYLVAGSQNIIINTASRVSVRKGYALDGPASKTLLTHPPTSFDWVTSFGGERNMRTGSDNLQYRKVTSTNLVTWVDLMTGVSPMAFNYTTFFETSTEKITVMLAVNGSSNIYEWSGALADYASSTVNTITLQGTATWAQLGFYVTTAGRAIVINGTTYTYSGGESTTTLTGVAPDPTGAGYVPGNYIQQAVITHTNASLSGGTVPTTFPNGLIEVLNNQIYLGALSGLNSNNVYVSKVNDFTAFGYTTPVRVVGEGAQLTLKGTPTAFIPQESSMYICVVPDQWYQTTFTLSSDLSKESLQIVPLKTAFQQAALSQAAVSKIKNSVVLLTRETTLDELGRVVNILATPQQQNYSNPIKNDFDLYSFKDASVIYWRDNVYVAIPQEGLVLIYNMFYQWWETPQVLPVGRFAVIGGLLYAHDYYTQQSYQLFTGYNDNGNPIDARALFSFQNYGTRSHLKSFNEFYTEGYISSNAILTLGLQYDIDGCATNTGYQLHGSNSQFVCTINSDASLGKAPLGKNPLGGQLGGNVTVASLPPKFRWIKTFPRTNFYETQVSYSSNAIDIQWEILAFGPKVRLAADVSVAIKD